jgi:hypothetical protein
MPPKVPKDGEFLKLFLSKNSRTESRNKLFTFKGHQKMQQNMQPFLIRTRAYKNRKKHSSFQFYKQKRKQAVDPFPSGMHPKQRANQTKNCRGNFLYIYARCCRCWNGAQNSPATSECVSFPPYLIFINDDV